MDFDPIALPAEAMDLPKTDLDLAATSETLKAEIHEIIGSSAPQDSNQ